LATLSKPPPPMNQRHRGVLHERAAWAIFSPIKAILLSRNVSR
jgi:hypothetical protein